MASNKMSGGDSRPVDMRTLLGKGSGATTTRPEGGVDMQQFRHGAAAAPKPSGLVGLVKSAIEKITGKKK